MLYFKFRMYKLEIFNWSLIFLIYLASVTKNFKYRFYFISFPYNKNKNGEGHLWNIFPCDCVLHYHVILAHMNLIINLKFDTEHLFTYISLPGAETGNEKMSFFKM